MDREELKALLVDFMQKAESDHQADEILLGRASDLVCRAQRDPALSGCGIAIADAVGYLVDMQKRRHARSEEVLQVLPRLFDGVL